MKATIFKSATQNGLIIGTFLSLKFLFSTQDNTILASLAFALSISVIIVMYSMTVRFREKSCAGVISYKQSFSYLFQIYFYGSIVTSLVMLLYTQFIDHEYLETLMNSTLKAYDTFNFPINDNTFDLYESIFKPTNHAIINILYGMFGGAFWALILAAFVKKDKSIFDKK